jgi:hypothetical protein
MNNYIDSAQLFPDKHKLFYHNLPLNLLQIYFFTGFLANFVDLVCVNNYILILFTFFTFISFRFLKHKPKLFSPLLYFYAALTFLSLFNHLRFFPEVGFPQGARTMPITLLAMVTCRLCTVPGLFERAVTMNALPFVFLIPTGVYIEYGRYYSKFLTENILGSSLHLAFAVGANALWERRYNWKVIVAFFSSASIMFLGASRVMFIYFISSTFTLIISKRKFTFSQFSLATLLFFLVVIVAVPIMTVRQQDRFGADFSWKENVINVLTGETKDRSAIVRYRFNELAFCSINQNWLGFGNANFPYVIRNYAHSFWLLLPEAGHPHSGFGDSLITAGYPGLLLYIVMLLYLLRIGYKDRLMRLCLVWLFLQIFLSTTLNNRILWPLMAIAERELQLSRSAGSKGSNLVA